MSIACPLVWSRRQVNMDYGRRISSIEDLPSQILDTGVDHLPSQLLDNLGLQLFNEGRGMSGNWEGVAEELGINSTREVDQIRRRAHVEQVFPGRLMLREWARRDGSTVFVLLNALRSQGREDCIDLVIKACQDVHSMQLLVKIEKQNGQQQYLSVTTKKEATLAASLENVLSGLPSYKITGPDPKLTWQTPAYYLKGRQLSLRRIAVTEQSEITAYGMVSIDRQKSAVQHQLVDDSPESGVNQFVSPNAPVPLNIPVTHPAPQHQSVSNNFPSTTDLKVPMPLSSMPTSYNNLSKQEQRHTTNSSPMMSDNFHSLTSNPNFFTNNFASLGPAGQTLLKKQVISIDESVPNIPNVHSMTVPSDLNSLRVGSLDLPSETFLKRCDPLRHSADQMSRPSVQMCYPAAPIRHPVAPGRHPVAPVGYSTEPGRHPRDPVKYPAVPVRPTAEQMRHHEANMVHSTEKLKVAPPAKHVPNVADYIPITHPVISFSNQIQNLDKLGMASSPPKCGGQVQHEDYVSPESLTGSAGKPSPCVRFPIHVSSDKVKPPSCTPPKPAVKPKPCVLLQRKDGYIDIVEEGRSPGRGSGGTLGVSSGEISGGSSSVLRQQSVPEATPMHETNTDVKERPKSLPDEVAKATPPPCVVSRDASGYATFAASSSNMEVDEDDGSGGNVTFSCPVYIETDNDGYLSYSGASDTGSASLESAMESDVCDTPTPPTQRAPMVIQQSTDGYFGFSSAPTSSVSLQTVPPPCSSSSSSSSSVPSEYLQMNRSESLPNAVSSERNADGLLYARFSEEDEEEDADYFDMAQLPNVRNRQAQQANVNRHWSAGDIEYLDILPTSSQYDYINENEQIKPRALPPRPTHAVPMKRLRLRQTGTDSKKSCDLDTVPGWCSHETEESICNTMKRYQEEDGNFIVWWMDRKKRYVVTVSHMSDLRHYAIYEKIQDTKVRMFIFSGGHEFDNLKSLIEHYMREGLKGPEVPTGQSRGKRWQQFSHVRLRKPLKVKYTHTVIRKKST